MVRLDESARGLPCPGGSAPLENKNRLGSSPQVSRSLLRAAAPNRLRYSSGRSLHVLVLLLRHPLPLALVVLLDVGLVGMLRASRRNKDRGQGLERLT